MKYFSFLAFLIVAQGLAAQTFTEVPPFKPLEAVGYSSVAFADVDDDEDQDVLVIGVEADGDRVSKLYLNNGQGVFNEVENTPFAAVDFGDIAFADVDGDGDKDVLITGAVSFGNPISKLYLNDGAGNFSEVTGTPFEAVESSSVAFSDVDSDGDQDVLITGFNSAVIFVSKLYINDGNGNFSVDPSAPFEDVGMGSTAFADVNGDTHPDVIISGQNNDFDNITKLYINNGGGGFVEDIGVSLPGVSSSSIAFADVDGDQDQDFVLTGAVGSSTSPDISYLYKNDGSGNFDQVLDSPLEGVALGDVAFADVDGDNDLDLFVCGSNENLDDFSNLYSNDGNGNFTLNTLTLFEPVVFSSIAFADTDGDDDLDLLLTGLNEDFEPVSNVYINNGDGIFDQASGAPFDDAEDSSVAFADVDGDNDLDVLFTGQSLGINISKLYINQGNGDYLEVADTPFEEVEDGSIAFADIDGDNDLDVMITGAKENFDAISSLYINDGNGNFSESIDNSFTGVAQSSIAFADIDGDNDLDLFISGQNISETPAFIAKLYINDGGGTFTEVVGTPFTGVFNSSIAFSDIDGDNDQDLLITGQPSPASFSTTLYTNDGQGNFTEVANSPIADVGFGSIDFADVEGDGDEDLLITGFTEFGSSVSVLYTNDGTGNFEEVMNTPFEDVGFSSIAFADIDNDNDQDVLIAGFGINKSRLYLNDGLGNFSELSDVPFLDVILGTVALADIDGDSDKDVLISGFSGQGGGQTTRLYINEGSISNAEDRFDLPDFEFVVFPNPVIGSQLQLIIETGQSNLITIGIFDIMGRQISQNRQAYIGGQQSISLDIDHMQTGNYIIQIDDGHRRGRRLFCVR